MVCIYCGSKTRIINSRAQKRQLQTWRRHSCTRCQAIFTTHERADLSGSIRIAYPDGQMQPYNRTALLISVYEALGHRTDALTVAEDLEGTITSILLKRAQGARLTRSDVVIAAHDCLRRFDPAAGVYYHARHH